MTKEELVKNQFPNDVFLQSAVLQMIDKCVADLEGQVTRAFEVLADKRKRIEELEQENAELKELLNCNNCSELAEEECEVCAEYSHFKCKRKEHLTKAKELLNEFMRISKASDEDFEHDYSELIGEAENFLKE